MIEANWRNWLIIPEPATTFLDSSRLNKKKEAAKKTR